MDTPPDCRGEKSRGREAQRKGKGEGREGEGRRKKGRDGQILFTQPSIYMSENLLTIVLIDKV